MRVSVKEQITPGMLIGAVVVAVLLIGFLAWKFLGSSPDKVDQATIDARIAKKNPHGT
jgi:hypothetical protein